MTLRIREAAQTVGLTADTLRYYEKISLVPRPARGVGGQRTYGEKDLARLRFVTRAQALVSRSRRSVISCGFVKIQSVAATEFASWRAENAKLWRLSGRPLNKCIVS